MHHELGDLRHEIELTQHRLDNTQREVAEMKMAAEVAPAPPLPKARPGSLDDLREQLRAAHREPDAADEREPNEVLPASTNSRIAAATSRRVAGMQRVRRALDLEQLAVRQALDEALWPLRRPGRRRGAGSAWMTRVGCVTCRLLVGG